MTKKIVYIGDMHSSFQRELFKYLLLYGRQHEYEINQMYYRLKNFFSYYHFVKHFIAENFIADILFIEFLADHAYYSSLLNLRGIPIVVRCHRGELYEYASRYLKRLYHTTLAVDKIVCVSNAIKNRLIHFFPWAAKKAITIHNAVDPIRFAPSKRRKKLHRFIIGSLGYLVPRKGFHELVLMVKELIDEGYEDIILRIGGKGVLYELLKRLIEQYGLKDKVFLDGYIPSQELPNWYNSIDLFILNSKSEGLSTVVLEAMASGLPVVATNVGGMSEVLNSKWLYEPGNTKKVLDLIINIYNMSNEERGLIGSRNRNIILERFDIRKKVKEYLRVFDKLLA